MLGMQEFIVQWYDLATNQWRKFGPSEEDPEVAKVKARDLYKSKRADMSVRVRCEETIAEWSKWGEGSS